MGKAGNKTGGQRALIIGVSNYRHPINELPAVANDLREMAKLLSSKNGAFQKDSITTLVNKTATRDAILSSLDDLLSKANSDETIFVYLAGHGTVSEANYFFLPYDVDADDIEHSGVPLTIIKALFDRCKSRQVFLWMDFCHSGGILARGVQVEAMSVLRRTLKVVQGQGKIIVAACTSSQSAFESPSLGHGLFTHALLRGLKGEAKSSQGEVTAASLYDFIDHQVASPDQQPVFFGEMTGRIVLMHFEKRTPGKAASTPAKTASSRPKKSSSKAKGTYILLGDDFFIAECVRNHSDGSISIELTPRSGDEEVRIAAMRPGQFRGRTRLPFAVNNDAYEVQVEEVVSEYVGSHQKWNLTLRNIPAQLGFPMEMSVNGVGPDQIARMRAGRILLNDPPPRIGRGFGEGMLLESSIVGSSDRYQTKESVIREVFRKHGSTSEWKEMARLKAVFLLKITGTVEHIIELALGTVRGNKVKVSFKGRRSQRYDNREPEIIEITGVCELA